MENLNFSPYGFLSEKDKKNIIFLYKDVKRNHRIFDESATFIDIYQYFLNKFGKVFKPYYLYIYAMIIRNRHLLEGEFKYMTPYHNNEEEFFLNSMFKNKLIESFTHSEKFIKNLDKIRRIFSLDDCNVILKPYKSEGGMTYTSFKTTCYGDNDVVTFTDTSGFYIIFDIKNYNKIEVDFDIYTKKRVKFIVDSPWGSIKNIDVDGMITLITETLDSYYIKFFEDYLSNK